MSCGMATFPGGESRIGAGVHFSWAGFIIGIVLLVLGLSMIIARKWWATFTSRAQPA